MHRFEELIYRSTSFTLEVLEETNSKIIDALQTSGSTILVKNLQMIQFQKVIFAIGMFSMFDAILQDNLSCENGFKEAKKRLLVNQNLKLHDRFDDFICAINVLKHGKGRRIPKKFILVDSTVLFYPKSFWLDNIDLKDEKVIKEIEEDEHHPFNNVYIFSQKEYDVLISDDEKKYLSQACQKFKSKKIKIAEKKYFTVETTNNLDGFYFLVSEPVYSSNNQFAFVEVDIKSKGVFLDEKTDEYFGVLKIIFSKDANGIWKQIGNYGHLIF